MKKPPTYLVPEQDRDLLDCGQVLTPGWFENAGFIPCQGCGEPIPPGWFQGQGWCSRACRTNATTLQFRQKLQLQGEHHRCALLPLEAALLDITLTNFFRAKGRPYTVEVMPREGFHVRIDGQDYVGAQKAHLDNWPVPTPPHDEAVLDALLSLTVVRGQSGKVGYSERPWAITRSRQQLARLPKNPDREVLQELVWAHYVFRGETFVQTAAHIRRSPGRAAQIYDQTLRDAHREAQRQLPLIQPPLREEPPKPPQCLAAGHGVLCVLEAGHQDPWHRAPDGLFEWNGPQWRTWLNQQGPTAR